MAFESIGEVGSGQLRVFQIPTSCPICSSILVEDGQFLFCRSRACPAQLSGAVKVWVSRLGLLHWGDSLIDALTDSANPRVSSLADLYRLSVDDIASCCSGQKFAQKCWSVLHSNKRITLTLLLASLNIPNLAVATATDIVQAGYSNVDKLLALTLDDLLKVPNVGHKTAGQILQGISEKSQSIRDLSEVLDVIEAPSGPLQGCSFCITGATSRPRKAVEKMIMDAGGVVKSSVGSGLKYLVTNDKDTTSSKMKNAKKHGTAVISEQDLYSMIEVGQNP